jgi:CheY-like chemotaxis protein
MAFSRQQVLRARVLDLGAVIVQTGQLLQRTLGEDIEIVTVVEAETAKITADQGQIEQVVLNLAMNARDAMPNGGELRIEVRTVDVDASYAAERPGMAVGPHARLVVSDNGVGMEPGVQARAFEPFFTTKERGKGTGLGLSTVYGIVQQSGGHIHVRSEPGRGTTFTIDFPRAQGPVATPSSTPPKPTARRAYETILLVEDDSEVRRLVALVLRADGYQVLEAANAADAIMLVDGYAGPIDLLLSDVVLPRANGGELAECVRRARPGTKVVLMSGYAEDPPATADIPIGAEFIPKPIVPSVILSKLRGLFVAPS